MTGSLLFLPERYESLEEKQASLHLEVGKNGLTPRALG
jgi:hypothetical protein